MKQLQGNKYLYLFLILLYFKTGSRLKVLCYQDYEQRSKYK